MSELATTVNGFDVLMLIVGGVSVWGWMRMEIWLLNRDDARRRELEGFVSGWQFHLPTEEDRP